MTLRHRSVEEFELRLHELFGRIDGVLEVEFGELIPRDPRRPPVGSTADHTAEGLFHLGASFTTGYGSAYGPGYVVAIEMRAIRSPPIEIQTRIENRAIQLLQRELAAEFPDRKLEVVRDGTVWKIVGDLSLGQA